MTSRKQAPRGTIALTTLLLLLILGAVSPARTQTAKTPYPAMAPLDQYLIADRNAEIALARSAGPDSISRDAEVLVVPESAGRPHLSPADHPENRSHLGREVQSGDG